MTWLRLRYYGAIVLLFGSLIGWPVSALTVAKSEPPFILGLSWIAITLTAADLCSTLGVRLRQDAEGAETAEKRTTVSSAEK